MAELVAVGKCWFGDIDRLRRRSEERGPRCDERQVPGRIYCEFHLQEAMARVAMVTPVVDAAVGLRWSGVVRGTQVGDHRPTRTAPV